MTADANDRLAGSYPPAAGGDANGAAVPGPGGPATAVPRRSTPRFRPASRVRVTAEAPRSNERWTAVPLSTRLVLVISGLLAFGLALGAMITLTVLRTNLIEQVDSDLANLAWELDEATPDSLDVTNATDATLPSNYFVRVQRLDGLRRVLFDQRSPGSAAGLPRLPEPPDPMSVVDNPLRQTVPGTSVDTWRAMTVPWLDPDTREVVGVITVALPLQSTNWAIDRTSSALLATSALIIVVGTVVSLFVVRRALRPLRRIESTAQAISQGDLSRRLPDMPVTTEVGSLARSLNVMLAQIDHAFAEREGSEKRMSRFVSDASHELRTPLATIRGYAELYRMGGVGPEHLPEVMGRIEGEANRMGSLVGDLTALARLDEGRRMEYSFIDLVRIARDTVSDLGALDDDRVARVVGTDGQPGAELTVPEEVLVRGDENRVRQVLTNLMGNVLTHTPDGVPLEIAVGTSQDAPGMAILEVRDHGPGIPEEERARVFERFHRVDESRNRASGGSGLGLAIVLAIVEAHRGTVEALETPGGGATMRVMLPVTTPDAEAAASRG